VKGSDDDQPPDRFDRFVRNAVAAQEAIDALLPGDPGIMEVEAKVTDDGIGMVELSFHHATFGGWVQPMSPDDARALGEKLAAAADAVVAEVHTRRV